SPTPSRTTASPTPSRTTSSPTPSTTGGCTGAFSVASSWAGGFVANVGVTAGAAAINGWRVTLTLPNGTAITNLWNGVNTGTTGTVPVVNQAYNGHLSAGG